MLSEIFMDVKDPYKVKMEKVSRKKFDELYDIILRDDGVPDILGVLQVMNFHINQMVKVRESEEEDNDESNESKTESKKGSELQVEKLKVAKDFTFTSAPVLHLKKNNTSVE